MSIDKKKGIEEADAQKELFDSFGDNLPPELEAQREALIDRLKKAPPVWQSFG